LCLTASLTIAFFLFNGPVIELESQVVKGLG
jgi:multicomponent Na+:H+ antiporter subunit D